MQARRVQSWMSLNSQTESGAAPSETLLVNTAMSVPECNRGRQAQTIDETYAGTSSPHSMENDLPCIFDNLEEICTCPMPIPIPGEKSHQASAFASPHALEVSSRSLCYRADANVSAQICRSPLIDIVYVSSSLCLEHYKIVPHRASL